MSPDRPLPREVLTPAEIRSRLDTYLATPGLSLAEKEAALEFLDDHPEVAAVAGHGIEPGEVRRQAEVVLELHDRTRRSMMTMPEEIARLHARAGDLARAVCQLFGSDRPAR